jgi:transcription elongation factor
LSKNKIKRFIFHFNISVDPDNLSFKSKFKRKIEEYTQNWIVSDIRIDSKRTKEVNVDSEHNDDVDVANGDEKSFYLSHPNCFSFPPAVP